MISGKRRPTLVRRMTKRTGDKQAQNVTRRRVLGILANGLAGSEAKKAAQ